MKRSRILRIALGFGLAVVLLVGLVYASFRTTASLEDTAYSVTRALRAVNAANELHERVELARVGVGAYLASGDQHHLESRRVDSEAIARSIEALRGLDRADSQQQRRLDSIASMLRREAEWHDRMIARRGVRALSPAELLDWHEELDHLHRQVHRRIDDEIEAVERERLAITASKAGSFGRSAMLLNVLGGLAGIAIVMVAALVTVRDARKRSLAEGELEYRASHDDLTGLPNRSQFQECLERNINSTRAGDGSFALLLIDLDRFKQINDTLGHHFGDVVLQQMNPRLQASLRGTDLVARLGGDEFAILLPGSSRETALHIAQRILTHVKRPIVVDGHVLVVGASIGIALFPEHGGDASALLHQADQAMYRSKRTYGRQPVSVAETISPQPEAPVDLLQPTTIGRRRVAALRLPSLNRPADAVAPRSSRP